MNTMITPSLSNPTLTTEYGMQITCWFVQLFTYIRGLLISVNRLRSTYTLASTHSTFDKKDCGSSLAVYYYNQPSAYSRTYTLLNGHSHIPMTFCLTTISFWVSSMSLLIFQILLHSYISVVFFVIIYCNYRINFIAIESYGQLVGLGSTGHNKRNTESAIITRFCIIISTFPDYHTIQHRLIPIS